MYGGVSEPLMAFGAWHPREKIVEHKPGGNGKTPRMASAIKWEEKANQMDQVRRSNVAKPFAFSQRRVNQSGPSLRQVAQSPMDELRGPRRGRTGEIAFVDQGDAQPAHRGVARDRRAVDSAADYRDVEGFTLEPCDLLVAKEFVVCLRRHHAGSHARAYCRSVRPRRLIAESWRIDTNPIQSSGSSWNE